MDLAEEQDHLATMLKQSHREALDILESIDQNSLVYEDGGWTVKDVIGYLVAWEAEGLAVLQAHSAGNEHHANGTNETVDTYAIYAEVKDSAAERVYAEWEAVRELLRATICEMPTERLTMTVHGPLGEYGHVDKLVSDLIAYQQEHLEAILRSQNKRAS